MNILIGRLSFFFSFMILSFPSPGNIASADKATHGFSRGKTTSGVVILVGGQQPACLVCLASCRLSSVKNSGGLAARFGPQAYVPLSADAFPYYAIYCSISEKQGKVILTNLNAILIPQTVQNDHNPWKKTENRKITFRSRQKRHCGIKRAKRRRERLHFRATALMLDAIRAAAKMQLTREEGTAMTNKYLGIGKFKK
ncbi:MAG: hypothetical protein PUC04_07160 [Firmicutes bacterium]|nr:hypothetical protein [Bacillota bacterium]